MSDGDAQISAVSFVSHDSADAAPLVVSSGANALLGESWSNWAAAGSDAQPADQGIDSVNGDSGDWFPSVASSGIAALALASDADPLISIPSPDLANASPEAGVDDTVVSFPHPAVETASVWETLSVPIDHSSPLDHIEWHFTGLLPLV